MNNNPMSLLQDRHKTMAYAEEYIIPEKMMITKENFIPWLQQHRKAARDFGHFSLHPNLSNKPHLCIPKSSHGIGRENLRVINSDDVRGFREIAWPRGCTYHLATTDYAISPNHLIRMFTSHKDPVHLGGWGDNWLCPLLQLKNWTSNKDLVA